MTRVNEKHPKSWNPMTHYDFCSQSCPCCRSQIEGAGGFGTCPVCDEQILKQQQQQQQQ